MIFLRKKMCDPSHFLSIATKINQVSYPQSSTACSTTLQNISDTLRSPPYRHINVPNLLHTNPVHMMFHLTDGQSSSVWSMVRPKYLKFATPSTLHPPPSIPHHPHTGWTSSRHTFLPSPYICAWVASMLPCWNYP